MLAVIDTLFEFLDRSPAAVVLLDGQKRVVFANEQAVDIHTRADCETTAFRPSLGS